MESLKQFYLVNEALMAAKDLLESMRYVDIYNSEEAQNLYHALRATGMQVDVTGGIWPDINRGPQ